MHAHGNCNGTENANGNKNGTQTERRPFLTSTVDYVIGKFGDVMLVAVDWFPFRMK